MFFFFFKQKTAYEMRISDWSSDVCSSDLDSRSGRRLYCGSPGGCGGSDIPDCGRRGARLRTEHLRFFGGHPEHDGLSLRGYGWWRGTAVSDRRWEDCRGGNKCVSTGRSRWSPDHQKQKACTENHCLFDLSVLRINVE